MEDIQINKWYHCYDDGKITPSRHYKVFLTGKFALKDREDLTERVKANVDGHDWLFNDSNLDGDSAILEGVSYERPDMPEKCWFMLACSKAAPFWFGIGVEGDDPENSLWGRGELDIDGSLTDNLDRLIRDGYMTTKWKVWIKKRDCIPDGKAQEN